VILENRLAMQGVGGEQVNAVLFAKAADSETVRRISFGHSFALFMIDWSERLAELEEPDVMIVGRMCLRIRFLLMGFSSDVA